MSYQATIYTRDDPIEQIVTLQFKNQECKVASATKEKPMVKEAGRKEGLKREKVTAKKEAKTSAVRSNRLRVPAKSAERRFMATYCPGDFCMSPTT
jgi:hypothetical protein